ncbi:MATH and LRR domain-containing protein PFE0570w [Ostrinia nubilalis]|uniref:MATH and LRR domain-containing protein PFE0570w n=1 Tax=Ostrinia nubilalis TaxID=29057 RepID=UPI0030823FB7
MRRTYRSKKETGGALDHRDVIQALDEKSSAFEAYYIQNIKQTKRELSCVGSSNHYGTAASKVRKRKYVKRIVKDPEPPARDSGSTSAFLTPDKSLRVNKVQDLFDQLLNSSSPGRFDSPKNSRPNIFKYRDKPETKAYGRKKLSKIKKFNCSSSDSFDSDKENSNESCNNTKNVTDLKAFDLLIETERKPSPKHLDESITNIVNNISIFNKLNSNGGNSSRSSNNPNNYAVNRLTTNLQTPSGSPLCSTPFKEKYRSQSIYKFSPISFGKNDDSPNYVTIIEENDNDSVVIVDKDDTTSNSHCEDYQPSPVIHLSVNSVKGLKNKLTSKSPEPPKAIENKEKSQSNVKICRNSQSNVEISSIEISDFQTTEAEPFYGFSNEPTEALCIKNQNNSLSDESVNNEFENSSNRDSTVCKNSETDCNETKEDNSIGLDDENESSYGTCNSEQSSHEDVEEFKNVPIVKIERLNDSMLQKYYEKYLANKCEKDDCDETSELDSDDYMSIDDIKSVNDDSDNFDNSDLENVMPDEVEASDASGTFTDNDSSLENNDKSFENNDNSSENNDKSLENNDNSSENNDNSLENNDISSQNNDNNLGNNDNSSQNNDISLENNDNSLENTTNNENERCISFVTTRRRNEITNDSLLYGFNNSYGSASSTDCDKTVVSNNGNNSRHSISSNLDNSTDNNKTEVETETRLSDDDQSKDEDLLENSHCEDKNGSARFSSVTARKSSRLPRESNMDEDTRKSLIENEGKPAIVLQPGKKWERSLSIYKRMTMMELDHSLLDDDELVSKGRKYRQSVISTMELQDFKGSLNNESIISRRSTFVSKPCRSTIRIIKEPNASRLSLCSTSVSEDLKGFLHEDCDDTIVELSKLSIADSENEVTVIENFHDTSNRVSTAREYVLRRCGQTDAILFDECYPETVLKNCRKIGEGVYGEVFLWRAGDGRARVMKIVPIAGTTKVNGERQKDFQEIISEIVIAMELSALRAPIDEIQREFDAGKEIDTLDLHSVENATDVFNEVLAVRCVYGGYPSRLLDLWELYDECKGSENDNPAVLPSDQQYIVLELANAGQDLESFEFNNAEQAHALFLQIAFGLAVGEEAFQFEHRDLHWGNVLIAPTEQKFATFVLRGRAHRVARCGVAGTIIDYSLSRLSLPLARECAALYNDLGGDDSLFEAVGDYQFAVYRLMRDKLRNDWKNFEPYTNILWLHYTVDKMITALRYKRTSTKIHKHYIAKLKGIKNRILDYGSAAQFVLTDNEF